MQFDFIEIGTSDFDTLMQNCDDDKIGMSIEPIKEYLNLLPNKKNVIKVNCAISDKNSTVDLFYLEIKDIEEHNLPHWIRGCNSIITPHISTQKILKERNLEHLCKTKKCESITWDTLVDRYDIVSVDFLKIDTEGHDCQIIRNIINSKTNVRPKKILFENNILTDSNYFLETLIILQNNKYKILQSHNEDVIVERNDSY